MCLLEEVVCVFMCVVCLHVSVSGNSHVLFSQRGGWGRCCYRQDQSMIHRMAAHQKVCGEDEGQIASRCRRHCQNIMKSPSSYSMQMYRKLIEAAPYITLKAMIYGLWTLISRRGSVFKYRSQMKFIFSMWGSWRWRSQKEGNTRLKVF